VGVKRDKGRKRRRADKWKWKEGADENKTFWVPTPAPPVDNFFLHFPPINNIGWTKKNHFNDSKLSQSRNFISDFFIGWWNFTEFSDWSPGKKSKKIREKSGKIVNTRQVVC